MIVTGKYHPKFVNAHHQHILNGDLSIIKSDKLRDLFYKGPKYREPQTIDFDIARSSIEENLDTFIETISKKKGLLVNNFIAWKNYILSEVDSRISSAKTKFRFTEKGSIFQNPDVKEELRCLQEHFVLCPVDKASNNIAIVCKQLYAKVILEEVNFTDINAGNNPTYELVHEDQKDIVQRYKDFQESMRLTLEEDYQKLPQMHWTTKIHKEPVSSRFIIGSKISSLKPLGKYVLLVFSK